MDFPEFVDSLDANVTAEIEPAGTAKIFRQNLSDAVLDMTKHRLMIDELEAFLVRDDWSTMLMQMQEISRHGALRLSGR